MDIFITLKKAVLGFLTFAVGYLSTNPQAVTDLIPKDIATMTIGGGVAALIVAVTNWLKHKED